VMVAHVVGEAEVGTPSGVAVVSVWLWVGKVEGDQVVLAIWRQRSSQVADSYAHFWNRCRRERYYDQGGVADLGGEVAGLSDLLLV
jgi:hypothetical protein